MNAIFRLAAQKQQPGHRLVAYLRSLGPVFVKVFTLLGALAYVCCLFARRA